MMDTISNEELEMILIVFGSNEDEDD
jgi:hypothetical protein